MEEWIDAINSASKGVNNGSGTASVSLCEESDAEKADEISASHQSVSPPATPACLSFRWLLPTKRHPSMSVDSAKKDVQGIQQCSSEANPDLHDVSAPSLMLHASESGTSKTKLAFSLPFRHLKRRIQCSSAHDEISVGDGLLPLDVSSSAKREIILEEDELEQQQIDETLKLHGDHEDMRRDLDNFSPICCSLDSDIDNMDEYS